MTQWALVTGAAGGIGWEFAQLLAKENFNLFLVDLNEEALLERAEEIRTRLKKDVKTLALNLGRAGAAEEVFEAVHSAGVQIHTLINNAGFGMFGPFAETDWNREEVMLYLHVHTPTRLVKLFLPEMVTRESGAILNVASLAAFHPGPLMCMYYSTKAYLLSFSTSVANELKGTGVQMTVLCPGITKTGFQKAVGSDDPKIKVNMASAADVVAFGYKKLKAGKSVAVPGFTNKLILFLRRFLSYPFQASCVRYIQEKNREKVGSTAK